MDGFLKALLEINNLNLNVPNLTLYRLLYTKNSISVTEFMSN